MCEEIRIYVADLAAYNNGKLHGVWIDATLDIDEMNEAVAKMLKASPEGFAEEYAIHDYEGFGSYPLGEYEGLQAAHDIACFIEECDEVAPELLNYYSNLEEAKRVLEENYIGCFESIADYAQEITQETTDIPKQLEYYIDYEKLGRDMELSSEIFAIEAGYQKVHIFVNY